MSNEELGQQLQQQIKERRAQNKIMLAHLYETKHAYEKRGKESALLFNAEFCEYKCIFGIDALIAALEIETKNNQ
jgi:23S rRNA maturation mini-RNase III